MEDNKMDCQSLMLKLQELGFAAVDLNIYLDNHPDCKNALADFNAIARELSKVKKMYEAENGALTNFGCSESNNSWTWINEPWPWELSE